MSQKQLLQYLNFICSPDEDTQRRGMTCLISTSVLQPQIILSGMNEIKLLITSLCVSKSPKWGTISSILLALTNTIKCVPDQIQDQMCTLISISKEITYSFLHSTSLDHAFRPHLFPFVNAISKAFQSGVTLNIEIFLKISEHCSIGFAPFASFLPVITSNLKTVINLISSCDSQYYPKLADPIESPDIDVTFFYVSIWAISMKTLINRPSAIQILMKHTKQLMELSNCEDAMFHEPCQFLLFCCRALQSQHEEIKQKSNLLLPILMDRLKFRENLVYKAIESQMKETQEKPKTFMVQRTVVEVLQKKGRNSKWKQFELILADEAKILLWTTHKNLLREGVALHMKDITEVKIIPNNRKEVDRDNVIKINTHKKEEYLIAFKTQQETIQWQNLIHALLANI
ncbi:hypothetical protein TRFO_12373 [Tritrichomonas foetus]|uniref:PH domain-containing protein n=1 Tax=Tritrichomonas foetus TaxID=1144522 RepID=A0A1J4L1M4_9EUKA|nr:hypothetical protein TRFO_12373 [Tritrichomonas foetus]|eukprot:OHT17417.1 hypothetical protein TRFO_12373 [Tritrichomonas foetus]